MTDRTGRGHTIGGSRAGQQEVQLDAQAAPGSVASHRGHGYYPVCPVWGAYCRWCTLGFGTFRFDFSVRVGARGSRRVLNRPGRLATLGAVLVDRPTDIEVSAEVRGRQRVLIALIAAQAKHVAASPVQAEPRGLS